jgi:AraC-like DNA-binding protein
MLTGRRNIMPYMSTFSRRFEAVRDERDSDFVLSGIQAAGARHDWLDRDEYAIGALMCRVDDTIYLNTQSTAGRVGKKGPGGPGGAVVGIALVHEGSASLTHGVNTLEAQAGDCYVFDDSDFVYDVDGYHDRSMVLIPCSRLRNLGLSATHLQARGALLARDGVADILFSHLDAVARRLNRGPEPSRNSLAAINTATLQMIAAVLVENEPAKEAELVSAAKAYMDDHLLDADLSPAAVATALHVSTRTLYRSFQGSGQSVAEYMRSARLLRAKGEFDFKGRTVNINVVADRWGFMDKSHFASLFRQQFGCLPSDYIQDI